MLPTLYEWSISHIGSVFEAKSEDECLRAIDNTFSRGIEFIANGKQLNRTELQRFILSMVASSGFRLKVQWQNALEVPRDESNRVSGVLPCLVVQGSLTDGCQDGVLGGYYIISNIRKTTPAGAPVPGRFARHKFVNVV